MSSVLGLGLSATGPMNAESEKRRGHPEDIVCSFGMASFANGRLGEEETKLLRIMFRQTRK